MLTDEKYNVYKAEISEELKGRQEWAAGITWTELCKNRNLNKSAAKEAVRMMKKEDEQCFVVSIRGHSEASGWEWRLFTASKPLHFDQVDQNLSLLESYISGARASNRRKKRAFEQMHPELARIDEE